MTAMTTSRPAFATAHSVAVGTTTSSTDGLARKPMLLDREAAT